MEKTMRVYTVNDRKKSNRPYKTSEKIKHSTANIRFQREVLNGEWGRTCKVNKKGKRIWR
jgi:hypothetical protein